MKRTLYSDRAYVMRRIRQISSQLEEEHKLSLHDSILDIAVAELAKIEMRELAQRAHETQRYSGERILSQAVDSVRNTLASLKPEFDFSDYLKSAEKKLRAPASELSDLRIRLNTTKQLARTGEETSVPGDQPYQLKELGLKGSIEGLLVYPESDSVNIDIDRLRELGQIEGEWFPYQLKLGDLTFVIDDDGSIFTSTEHLSERMLADAKELINKIAKALYA
jgi:hypothetical protein